MTRFLRAFWTILILHIIPDLLLLGGVTAVVWGVHFYSVAVAWILGGLCAIAAGVKIVGNS